MHANSPKSRSVNWRAVIGVLVGVACCGAVLLLNRGAVGQRKPEKVAPAVKQEPSPGATPIPGSSSRALSSGAAVKNYGARTKGPRVEPASPDKSAASPTVAPLPEPTP